MSRRRRHTPGPQKINPEPARCVCQPGPDAHPEHSKPGRVAAKHWDPRCPHWDRSSVAAPRKVVIPKGRGVGKTEQARIERLRFNVADDDVANDTG